MINSKVRKLDSAYSICFSQVLLTLITFLINTADKDIYNIFNSFLFPYYFNINRTHTHKHKSSFNIKDWLKHIDYSESEFRTFEFVKCKFIVVYMNIK